MEGGIHTVSVYSKKGNHEGIENYKHDQPNHGSGHKRVNIAQKSQKSFSQHWDLLPL